MSCKLKNKARKNITQRAITQTKIDAKNELKDGLMEKDDVILYGSDDIDDSHIEIEGYKIEMINPLKKNKRNEKNREDKDKIS